MGFEYENSNVMKGEKQKDHGFSSKNRDGINLFGVESLCSFDDMSVVAETSYGKIAIEGEGLHLSSLEISSGELNVEGRINGLFYIEPAFKKKKETKQ